MKQPTKAAIEAAISSYVMPTPETGPTEEMQVFTSEVLRVGQLWSFMQGQAVGALVAQGLVKAQDIPAATDPEGWRDLGQELKPYFDPITHIACMFFWIGWNARGAMEDGEKLEKMLGTTCPTGTEV